MSNGHCGYKSGRPSSKAITLLNHVLYLSVRFGRRSYSVNQAVLVLTHNYVANGSMCLLVLELVSVLLPPAPKRVLAAIQIHSLSLSLSLCSATVRGFPPPLPCGFQACTTPKPDEAGEIGGNMGVGRSLDVSPFGGPTWCLTFTSEPQNATRCFLYDGVILQGHSSRTI